jgi:colanic acid biosynthesis protein WcaH
MNFIEAELYNRILQVLPIACVDIVLLNNKDEILLLKRLNEPSKNEWWFPGGRILKGEKRIDAVERILRQECGIHAEDIHEFGTYELIQQPKHGITTVFIATSGGNTQVALDEQSGDFRWLGIADSIENTMHEFVSEIINQVRNDKKGGLHSA